MTIPLPEPLRAKLAALPHSEWALSMEIRAYGEAVRAEERDWWREIAEQLIACHDEPTCPAVTLARERLAAIRKGE